ncbi:MAG: B12-binding domain-containing radical SAM protein, partial [Alphaproteobacteria bacterium]|nr:B12-binding domain-containing radical SAM protein [Alphaproteobacteria bacterium]
QQIEAQGRLLHRDWDRYDTRQTVFQPARMSARQLEDGYWRAYRRFYSWPNLLRGSRNHQTWARSARHLAYAGGWKKLEPMWDAVIRSRRLMGLRPVLETILSTASPKRLAGAQGAPPALTGSQRLGHSPT